MRSQKIRFCIPLLALCASFSGTLAAPDWAQPPPGLVYSRGDFEWVTPDDATVSISEQWDAELRIANPDADLTWFDTAPDQSLRCPNKRVPGVILTCHGSENPDKAATGFPKGIHLADMGLAGVIPGSIMTIPRLAVLDLRNNSLSLGGVLSKLPSQYFDISLNNFGEVDGKLQVMRYIPFLSTLPYCRLVSLSPAERNCFGDTLFSRTSHGSCGPPESGTYYAACPNRTDEIPVPAAQGAQATLYVGERGFANDAPPDRTDSNGDPTAPGTDTFIEAGSPFSFGGTEYDWRPVATTTTTTTAEATSTQTTETSAAPVTTTTTQTPVPATPSPTPMPTPLPTPPPTPALTETPIFSTTEPLATTTYTEKIVSLASTVASLTERTLVAITRTNRVASTPTSGAVNMIGFVPVDEEAASSLVVAIAVGGAIALLAILSCVLVVGIYCRPRADDFDFEASAESARFADHTVGTFQPTSIGGFAGDKIDSSREKSELRRSGASAGGSPGDSPPRAIYGGIGGLLDDGSEYDNTRNSGRDNHVYDRVTSGIYDSVPVDDPHYQGVDVPLSV